MNRRRLLLGAVVAAKAKPDGQTIFVCSNTSAASNVTMMKSLPCGPIKDFEPVTLIGRAPVFLIVNPKVEATTAQVFVALCRKQPGKINFGSGSASIRISGELLKAKAQIDLVHVPKVGSARGHPAALSMQRAGLGLLLPSLQLA